MMDKVLPIIKLSDCLISFEAMLMELCDFSVFRNDFWVLDADLPEKAQLLFQVLATLIALKRGTYHLGDQQLNGNDYQCLLSCKKKIGYISPTISLISNRTLRENLLLTTYYEQNALYLPLSSDIESMCRRFEMTDKLDRRVTETSQWDLRTGLAIRELAKDSCLLLVERPEEMVPPGKRSLLIDLVKEKAASGEPVIFYSRNKKYIDNFSPTGRIEIRKETITITDQPCRKP